MSHAGCRSSGVLTASAVVSAERCKLISLHMGCTIGHADNMAFVQIYDSGIATTSGKTELARFSLANGDRAANDSYVFEADMHGVIASEGLYLVITGTSPGGNTDPTVYSSVEFA